MTTTERLRTLLDLCEARERIGAQVSGTWLVGELRRILDPAEEKGWTVNGGPAPRLNVESTHATVTEAIREAAKSGMDVWLHADDCTAGEELSADCPCRPVRVVRRTRDS